MRIYTAVSLQQDEFRTNRSYFLPVTIPVFCRYAQKAVRPCSCVDQAVTHTQTHQMTTITLRLRARVNNYEDFATRRFCTLTTIFGHREDVGSHNKCI